MRVGGNGFDRQQKEEHKQKKRTLKIAGAVVLGVGLLLAAIGLFDFFSSFGGGGFPELFFLTMIGFPFIAVGASLLSFGFRSEVAKYIKNESVDVMNEYAEDISPAVTSFAGAVKKGMSSDEYVRCVCGEENEKGSNFCKKCGRPLTQICPSCGADVESGSAFCSNCGKKL